MQPGVLTLAYVQAQPDPLCPAGAAPQTVITFTCSPGEIGTPVFVGRDAQCWYQFQWATQAACADSPAVGHLCTLQDPTTLATFDVSTLQPISLTSGNTTVHLSFCESPPLACNGAAACVVTQGSPPCPLATGNLTYGDSLLSLEFSGPPCGTATQPLHLTVFLVCGAVQAGQVLDLGPNFVSVQVSAAQACLHSGPVDCVATDANGNYYDLSVLTKTTGAWQARGACTWTNTAG